MNLIRMEWLDNLPDSYEKEVIGEPKSIYYLWFIMKDKKEILKLNVYTLKGTEIDMRKGINYIYSVINI